MRASSKTPYRLRQPSRERHYRLPPKRLSRDRDVRASLLWVVLRQWPVFDATVKLVRDELRNRQDGPLVRVSDVHHRDATRDVHQRDQTGDRIGHITEAPGLRAVSVNSKRLALPRLLEKVRN